MITKGLFALAILAAAGFAMSLVVHVAAWAGVAPPKVAWALHVGIFVVWLPTVMVSQKLTKDFKQQEFWTAALRGAPPWTPIALKCLVAYALVNFLLFIAQATQLSAKRDPALEARGFSGHWMIFYGAAAGTLYSAGRLRDRGERPRHCLNGHSVSLSAQYCERCGSPLNRLER